MTTPGITPRPTRHFLLMAADAATLAVLAASVFWLAWDWMSEPDERAPGTVCTCDQCVTQAQLVIQSAALRRQLKDLEEELRGPWPTEHDAAQDNTTR